MLIEWALAASMIATQHPPRINIKTLRIHRWREHRVHRVVWRCVIINCINFIKHHRIWSNIVFFFKNRRVRFVTEVRHWISPNRLVVADAKSENYSKNDRRKFLLVMMRGISYIFYVCKFNLYRVNITREATVNNRKQSTQATTVASPTKIFRRSITRTMKCRKKFQSGLCYSIVCSFFVWKIIESCQHNTCYLCVV